MSIARSHHALRRHRQCFPHCRQHPLLRRSYTSADSQPQRKQPSRHGQFYSDMLPGMIPVALLGSAVYLGLRLLQANLSQERYLDESRARVEELEREVETLREERRGQPAIVPPAQGLKKRGWFW